MRLRRLDLTRYGCFTGHSLDFGEPVADGPDFHLIYGPNEAGKSTVLSAVLDLLFGIELRSPYSFLHDYKSMRIGAALEIAGQTHHLGRIKRDKASLLGPDDQPVPETALNAALGSIDRAGYRTMFSLDDETLQSGGESILESEGDLGRLLFAATSGLSTLSRQLTDIREESDAFHRPGGRATQLRKYKEELAELKRRQRDLDTNARHYADLLETEATASAAYEAARIERDQNQARYEDVQRLLEAVPIWANLNALRSLLEPLRDLPDPPDSWGDEAHRLSQDEAARNAEINGAEQDLKRLSAELDDIAVDEPILMLKDRMDRLRDEESRYRSAADIPAREDERLGIDATMARLLDRLGQGSVDPAGLLLPVATTGALNELIESQSALTARRDSALRELEAAKDRVDQATKTAGDRIAAVDVSGLEAAITRIRTAEFGSRIAHLEDRLGDLDADIESDLIGLLPWQGSLDSLAELAPPEPARLERWKGDLATLREEQKALSRKQAELAEDRQRLLLDLKGLKKRKGVSEIADATGPRQARDQAWQAHRALLDGTAPLDRDGLRSTADAFEGTLAEDERIAGLRAGQADAIAKLDHLTESFEQVEASLTLCDERFKAARKSETLLAAEIAEALGTIGLQKDMEPADLERWLTHRSAVLEKRTEFRKMASKKQTAQAEADQARSDISTAMKAVGITPEPDQPLAHLLEVAHGAVAKAKEQDAESARLTDALQTAEEDLRQRQRDAGQVAQEMQAWEASWTAHLNGCWLGEAEPKPSPAGVREILRTLSELPPLIDKRGDLDHRIKAMRQDRTRFIESVQTLAAELGLTFEEDRALEIMDDLRLRLSGALQQVKLRRSKLEDLEQKKALQRQARMALDQIDDRRTEMCGLYGVETFTELLQTLRQAQEKTSLVQQVASGERDLLKRLALPSLSEAEDRLRELTGDESRIEALKAESATLASESKSQDGLVQQLFHESSTAREAIAKIGGDAAVARIEEDRRTLLLEIQDRAERYLRLRIGVAAAERALEIYRDRHRGSMITRASEAFRTISRGRFSDLSTIPGRDGDALVAIRSTGASLRAPEMSKGTCFQLYLALRIAGYHEFAENHETLPFIADDIMETFDDDRSAAAFRLLSDLGRKGQVVYLTHHAHMRDMAKQVCGDAVRLHELPAPLTPTESDRSAVPLSE